MPSVRGMNDAQLDQHMHAQGLYCYREYFLWGKTPAYRNKEKTQFRFVDRGDILTPAEMFARLLDEWRPVAREESDYASGQMRKDLEALQAKEDHARTAAATA